MKAICLAIGLLVVVSCKKKQFEHTAVFSTGSCELCDYADSLEGTYTGPVTGAFYFQQPCILTVTLEHVYRNLGNSLDSSTMYLRKETYNSVLMSTTVDTIAVLSRDGITYDDYGNHTFLTYDKYDVLLDAWTHYGYIMYHNFHGVR